MAKSFPTPSLLQIMTAENDYMKYKDIIDRNMTSARHDKGNLNTTTELPANGDQTPARPCVNEGESSLIYASDTVPCPTCRGTGIINTDDRSLVALIPVKDDRLKPKRTKLKIALAIVVTLLLCGLTVYFLFPRSPTLQLISVMMHNASFPESEMEDAYILIKNHYLVKNDNFVSVDLTSISVDVTWRKTQVGGPRPFYKFQKKKVDIRSSINFDVYINTTYSDETSPGKEYLRYLCLYDVNLLVDIDAELETSFLFHTEKISSIDHTNFLCNYNGTEKT